MNKKKIVALLVAFTMLFSTVAVFASGPTLIPAGGPSPTAAGRDGHGFIRKAIQVPYGTALPEASFNFNIVFYELDGSDLECECDDPTDHDLTCQEHLIAALDFPVTWGNVYDDSGDPIDGAGSVTIDFADGADFVRTAGGFTHFYAFYDLDLDGTIFPSTGIWVFDVTEEAIAFMDCDDDHYCAADCEEDDECKQHVWGFDESEWKLVVTVVNHRCSLNGCANPSTCDSTDLSVLAATMTRATYFNSSTLPEAFATMEQKRSEMQFLNQFVKYECYDPTEPQDYAALFIEKQVEGDGALNRQFEFVLTLHLPVFPTPCPTTCTECAPGPCDVWDITDGPDVPDFPFTARFYRQIDDTDPIEYDYGDVFQIGGATGEPHPFEFTLAHGERLYIAGLPMGTTYDLVELIVPGIASYEATGVVVTSGGTPRTPAAPPPPLVNPNPEDGFALDLNAAAGADYLVNLRNALISNDDELDNSAVVTNDREISTPMGVFLNNLPFIGLIVLAGAALTGFIVLKVRKGKEEELVEVIEAV
ncbi:MAG: hypothetical protein FWC92_06625 [Defluviitaleaceae bacterium]|nr:hypothetical protein [Defluviitaleaceae bacterium]